MDLTQEVFFAFTADGEILQWNQRVNDETGYSDEEIAEMHPIQFVPSEETGRVEQQIKKVLEEGHTEFESRFRTKEGREIPYEFTGTLFEWKEQKLICGAGRNITERQQPLGERELSGICYRRLFEDAQEGIAVTTPDGEIQKVNPAAAKIFGYPREELQSMNATQLYVNPSDREAIAAEFQDEGKITAREVRFRRGDGEEVVCELSGTLQRDTKGEPKLWKGFFRDVTEKKRAEEALRESEETFRMLAEGVLVGVVLLRNDKFVYVNPAFARITGYAPEEIVGRPPEIIFHPDDRPLVRQRIRERIEEGRQKAHYEARVRTKAGETRHVEVFGRRMIYQGEPAIIGTLQDVTELRELQREILQVQEEERKRLGKDLHDGIASQLTGVKIMLSNLARTSEGGDVSGEELAERIRKIRGLVGESIDEVRRLSRGLNPAGLSERGLPAALARLAENMKEGRFVVVDRESDGGEPVEVEAGDEVSELDIVPELEGDTAAHLYWITQEAIANARKYADADDIVIHLGMDEDTLVLVVEDDGTGFLPSEVDDEGLGLRSMRHRAELLGATFSVDSAPGEGTQIRCRLGGVGE